MSCPETNHTLSTDQHPVPKYNTLLAQIKCPAPKQTTLLAQIINANRLHSGHRSSMPRADCHRSFRPGKRSTSIPNNKIIFLFRARITNNQLRMQYWHDRYSGHRTLNSAPDWQLKHNANSFFGIHESTATPPPPHPPRPPPHSLSLSLSLTYIHTHTSVAELFTD